MSSAAFLPAPHFSRPAGVRLGELVELQVLEPARRAGYELHIVGTSRTPEREQVIVNTANGRWLLVDHRDDPTARPYAGRLPTPAEVFAKLAELDAHGVSPELLWVAHQLPAGWRDGDDLEHLIPPPARERRRDEVLITRLRTALDLTGRAATAVALGIGAVAFAPLALVGTDPILLGGVQHPTEPIVVWVELGRWEWE